MTETNEIIMSWKYERSKKELTREPLAVIVEQSVDLVVNDTLLLTFFCSPIDLEALALGFLWNEGLISELDEIENLFINPDKTRIEVSLVNPTDKPQSMLRTSTGVTILGESEKVLIDNSFKIDGDKLIRLFDQFFSKQILHKSAGGYHSAALSDGERIKIIVEDLGRHNCLDKISGSFLLKGTPFTPQIILLSGRISSEMIQKILRIGGPIIVSRTTPTAKAVEIANKFGVTIVGYLRGENFSIFTNPERICL